MLKTYISLSCLFITAILFQSCNEYKTTEGGLKYKIITDSAGPVAQEGGFLVFHYVFKNSKDSILRNTFKEGQPVSVPVQKPSFKGGLEEGFMKLSKGDSAVFLINADSLFEKTFKQPLPKEVAKGSEVKFIVKVVKLYSKDDVKKEQEKMTQDREAQMKETYKTLASDTLTILNYLKENKIKAKKTENGVYYSVSNAGKGKQIQMGDSLAVMYTGKLLDGKQFDSNIGKEPFTVRVGTGQVIYGWEEGLSKLKRGDKATLFIPSPLGYGPQGSGADIPPNSILLFEVEILN